MTLNNWWNECLPTVYIHRYSNVFRPLHFFVTFVWFCYMLHPYAFIQKQPWRIYAQRPITTKQKWFVWKENLSYHIDMALCDTWHLVCGSWSSLRCVSAPRLNRLNWRGHIQGLAAPLHIGAKTKPWGRQELPAGWWWGTDTGKAANKRSCCPEGSPEPRRSNGRGVQLFTRGGWLWLTHACNPWFSLLVDTICEGSGGIRKLVTWLTTTCGIIYMLYMLDYTLNQPRTRLS